MAVKTKRTDYHLLATDAFQHSVITSYAEGALDTLCCSFVAELHLEDGDINRFSGDLTAEQGQFARRYLELPCLVSMLLTYGG